MQVARLVRTDCAGNPASVPKQDQRRPESDAEGVSAGTAATILDAEMRDRSGLADPRIHRRPRGHVEQKPGQSGLFLVVSKAAAVSDAIRLRASPAPSGLVRGSLNSSRHVRRCNGGLPSSTFAALLLLCSVSLSATSLLPQESPMRLLVSFDNGPEEPRWVAVNDGVMGGRSSGGPLVAGGQLQFSGALSLENNGGFSSVRSVGRDFDLSDATAVVLRVLGDGRRYQLRLATDARYRGVAISFGAEFDTRAGEWMDVRVPLDSLQPTVRGSTLTCPTMDATQVRELGLLIADKREGAFALTVDWIAVE